ncbi:MAG: G8 domain-containing protein [Isosphaeraceae bacterium]
MNSLVLPIGLMLVLTSPAPGDDGRGLIRSAHDGRWSDASTWDGRRVPGAGDRVQVRAGHAVTYDVVSDAAVRSIHVAGTLRFDPDRDTRLVVGLIKIQAGDDAGESGFDCEVHVKAPSPGAVRPALEVGTPDRPIAEAHRAVIRLAPVPGLDPEECPAIVCCGGRMDFHGMPMPRTWVKLGAPAPKGKAEVTLAQPVPGWRSGGRVIVTATNYPHIKGESKLPDLRVHHETEERMIRRVDGTRLELDRPLEFDHRAEGGYRGEIGLLSRNVVVESAELDGVRGHTMYHRYSAGSISYAEFRHLGKAGKLGKYSLHFHRVGDTMRGSSVIGASIWDSGNRWITIHGTNALVVRDCVGYRSIGHGFFLEDGTEVDNLLDGNLAVLTVAGTPLPDQALGFDRNEGAGYWWANSRNAFVRNVAVECEQYGFRYEAPATPGFDPTMSVRGPDGTSCRVDLRTLPFLRFDANEAHTQRHYGVNLGGGPGDGGTGGVGGVGPDARHPFAIRDLKVWDARWGLTLDPPSVLVDGLEIAHCEFGLWRPRYERHAYRNVKFFHTGWAYFAERGQRPVSGRTPFPTPLEPVDDRPPVTVVTRVRRAGDSSYRVEGVSVDDGRVRAVRVNGVPARALAADFSRWEADVPANTCRPGGAGAAAELVAVAEDDAGHAEPTPHRLPLGAAVAGVDAAAGFFERVGDASSGLPATAEAARDCGTSHGSPGSR